MHEVAEGEKVFPYILFVDISGDDGHIGFVALGQHAHTFVVYIVVFALLVHDAQQRKTLCHVYAHAVAGRFHAKHFTNVGVFLNLPLKCQQIDVFHAFAYGVIAGFV